MYRDLFNLSGRVAVVTGGGRGIGFETCRALAQHGASIVIAEIDETTGPEAVETLRNEGHTAEWRRLDVTKPEEVSACAERIVNQFGHVDILVANAGIALTTPSETCSDDEWRQVIDINLNGVFWCNRTFGQYMLAAGKGSIVNLGSMSGLVSNIPQPQAHYNASKSAVHMLTKSLAGEWARRGVRVNAVAPTYVATEMTKAGRENTEWAPTWLEMTPMHRYGEPHEVAALILFLASDASSLMTGSIVVVDGGYTSW